MIKTLFAIAIGGACGAVLRYSVVSLVAWWGGHVWGTFLVNFIGSFAIGAIVASGGAADPVMLAGGIGTALTTTFWGLVVAIPALAGYALLRNRIDELTVEAALEAEDLVSQFRPGDSVPDTQGDT